ncbi:MAG TPA: hypothetical protein VLI41_00760 [Phenylobacterium sp.]|uniref:hypothetical protein n=1 Tax=Phenylobacterium sp. TaxID=1871053 RepID=UPI002B885BB2|nr:hypothetical protein [Phenylobacterium sp.]HSV01709.1 hypothetical protein [Phenylobacterium sp.]
MIALLLAAQMAAAPSPTLVGRDWALRHRSHARGVLSPVPPACRVGVTAAAGPSPQAFRPGVHKLGDLPRAHEEIAVERSVGGCPAPLIVRYDVEGDGRFAEGPDE